MCERQAVDVNTNNKILQTDCELNEIAARSLIRYLVPHVYFDLSCMMLSYVHVYNYGRMYVNGSIYIYRLNVKILDQWISEAFSLSTNTFYIM